METETVFKYADLSDEAKQKAREWMRGCIEQDWDGSDTIADAVTCLGYLGFDVNTDTRTNSRGNDYTLPAVYYQLSWSQGDGAVFEATWSAEGIDMVALLQDRPTAGDLKSWCAQLMVLKLRYPFAVAEVRTRSTGPGLDHMYVDDVDTGQDRNEETYDEWLDKQLQEVADHLAHWIYTQVRDDLEYRLSDESVEDDINCNAYEFNEDGERV